MFIKINMVFKYDVTFIKDTMNPYLTLILDFNLYASFAMIFVNFWWIAAFILPLYYSDYKSITTLINSLINEKLNQ